MNPHGCLSSSSECIQKEKERAGTSTLTPPEGYEQDLAKHFERPDELYAFVDLSIVQEPKEETLNHEAPKGMY